MSKHQPLISSGCRPNDGRNETCTDFAVSEVSLNPEELRELKNIDITDRRYNIADYAM